MPGPMRTPQGVTAIDVVSADLFVLAEQYLGDATQWMRISDLNAQDGTAPDYLIAGQALIQIPAKIASGTLVDLSVERLLFGRDS